MEGEEVGVAFLDDEGSEGEPERYVVEGEGFRVGGGEDRGGDGDLEGWCHGAGLGVIHSGTVFEDVRA